MQNDMYFFEADLKNDKDYPLVEYVFSLLDEKESVNDAVYALLERVGQMFELNMIAVKEVIPGEKAVRCTYEWSSDGKQELVNVESRYLDYMWEAWMESYIKDKRGVWTYYNGDGYCPVKIIRLERVEALLQLPIYRNNEFIACVDFIDSVVRREWTDDEIMTLKLMCRILSSYLFHIRDYDKSHEEKRQLTQLDSITKLPKYEVFYQEIKEAINNIDNTILVVTSSDISNFKYFNEKYGYRVGNEMMKRFAEHLYENSGKIVSACRVYSDNFITISKCDDETDAQMIMYVIEKMSKSFTSKVREDYFDSNLIVNTGISFIKSSYDDLENAIVNANIARKNAKNLKTTNGCRCLLFTKSMADEIKKHAEYIAMMETGLRNNEFIVHIQPKVMSDTKEIIGAEALVRWEKDNATLLYPDEFIPAFEKDGCIVKMDYYVYEQVFRYQKNRMDEKKLLVPISMNISTVHLYDKKLVPMFKKLLEKYMVPAEYFEIELIEQIYLSGMPNVKDTIDGLKGLGFAIYIDNFGKGFSSLNALTRFPIDGIKLDRLFMKSTLTKNDKIIISCIVDMANKLNLQVVCEGVETEEQRDFLIKINCPYIQGNLYSKPVDMKAFAKMQDQE